MAALQQRSIELIREHQSTLIAQWRANLSANGQNDDSRIAARDLDTQVSEFWQLLLPALSTSQALNLHGSEWQGVRHFLEDLSRDRAIKGFSSSETAAFIFSLKRPLFELLQTRHEGSSQALGEQLWAITELLDQLGLQTVKAFQKTREDVIQRQQEEMLELSTPV
ncbi:MAG: hypothetical protein GAK31_00309 [Stenotrophomonas maltophilia]|uniref:RsbT co-antagonist protein RsbRD N-terminal domain-containing protein n=1 Tax=Stenotrophomonas maltophilia TaxID=40324 RepID=A0A7V8JN36_STEMA|nr:MAG: hypothetical protein GAK31_00309 [Stenotrophomonas maltophilia]